MGIRGNKGSHGRHGSSKRSMRRSADWSSSVIGSHASGARSPQRDPRRTVRPRVANPPSSRRTGEVKQLHVQSSSATEYQRARYGSGHSRTAAAMRRSDRTNRIALVVSIILVIAIAFGLGTCAYRNSLTSSMALNDDAVTGQLASASTDSVTYTLVTGITGDGTSSEAASFVAVLRLDPQAGTASLLNIPSNIAVTYNTSSSEDGSMLRDAPHIKDEGELVKQVSSLIGNDINHYVRITDKGFASLVDSLGGLNVEVSQYVDDPTVGTSVLDPGQQVLSGKQALAYVSAKNYTTGFSQRATVQNEVFYAFANAVEEKGGLDFAMSADTISSCIKTDLSYDDMSKMAKSFQGAEFHAATVPGSQTGSGSKTYWSVSSSKASQVYDKFKSGTDMDITVDTSGVDKSGVSVVVLNGAGADGYSAQAAAVLTEAGFSISDTGNAESFVYDETLVIYRSSEDKTAAEAAVQALGVGRAVSAGVYYNLTTNLQVVVGKDWTSHV